MQKRKKKILLRLKKILPVKIRFVSWSLALFMLGWWLWTDTYFSVYVKEIIWNPWWVTVIWAILAFTRLLFVIPIGKMNDHINVKYILLVWKIFYVFCGLTYFLAGIFYSWVLLVVAAILNGFANATTFTTYRSYYAKNTTKSDNVLVTWIYFSSTHITEVIWALISAFLVNYLELPYMYFFVVIFALVSLLQDQKIKTVISKHYNRTWRKFYNRVKKESNYEMEVDEWWDSNKKFFGRNGFLRHFFRECLSFGSWKEIWEILKKYNWSMYVALICLMFVNFLNYTWFLFIPVIAVENNLSLSQIAIVYAVMKMPYIVNVFMGKFGDRYSKKLIISIILVLMSFLYLALWFNEWFYVILILTFFISLWVAVLNPLSSALVLSYTQTKDKWSMAWVQDFVSRFWDILWSLWFWTLTAIVWLQRWFVIIWLCTLWLWWYLMFKKLISYKSKNNEHDKSKEIYDLPVPVIDFIEENRENNLIK